MTKYYGPPGTGKTTRVLQHFEESIKETGPDKTLFATFTRAARLEALSRVKLKEDQLPLVRTIHSLSYRLSRVQHGQMVTPMMIRQLAYRLGIKMTGNTVQPDRGVALTNGDIVLSQWNLSRQRMQEFDLGDVPPSITPFFAEWLIDAYTSWKKAEHVIDYTDLLERYLEIGSEPEIRLAIVDEAQDLSVLQWKVVEKLTNKAGELVVAGDDDQAIFSWAGGDASRFVSLEADHEEVLGQSYRLPRAIHSLAVDITSSISQRHNKYYAPRAVEGVVRHNAVIDKDAVDSAGSCLILFRNHYHGQELSERLTSAGVKIWGDYKNVEKKEEARAELLSIHQAKGREADLVVLCPDVSRRTFDAQFLAPDDEARVWYVAVTRAKEELHVLSPTGDSYRL